MSGTTTITSLGTALSRFKIVTFSGVLTVTHNASSLILPNAVSITTVANDTMIFVSDGSGNWTCKGHIRSAVPSVVPSNYAADVIVEDQRASGTNAGASTSGSYETRTLNTLVRNNGSIASLASNQVTIPSGTYYAVWSAPSTNSTQHQSKLRNVTDSTDSFGTTQFAGSGAQTDSPGSVVLTIAASKAFAVQARVFTSSSPAGQGSAASFGNIEVYARLQLWKVA